MASINKLMLVTVQFGLNYGVINKNGQVSSCQWYEIGRRCYPIDRIKPTEKELSISHFKEGFATHKFVKPYCTVNAE